MFHFNVFTSYSSQAFLLKRDCVSQEYFIWHTQNKKEVIGKSIRSNIKMLYLIGPDGFINQRSVDFRKMVWMTIVVTSPYSQRANPKPKSTPGSSTNMLYKYKRINLYYIRFSHKQHLKGEIVSPLKNSSKCIYSNRSFFFFLSMNIRLTNMRSEWGKIVVKKGPNFWSFEGEPFSIIY